MNITIYLRSEDKTLWKQAKKITKLKKQSLSKIVVDALSNYVKENAETK